MQKVLIKITRTQNASVRRCFVLINDRVLPFANDDELNVYIWSQTDYGITVYCHGDKGGNVVVGVTRATGNVIEPLTVSLDENNDVDHASDRFRIA